MPDLKPEPDVQIKGDQIEIAAVCKEARALRDSLYPTIINGTLDKSRQKVNVQDLTPAIDRFSRLADPRPTPDDRTLYERLSSALHDTRTLDGLRETREKLQETINLLNTVKEPPRNASRVEWILFKDHEKRLQSLQAANELARAAETSLRVARILPLMEAIRSPLERQVTMDQGSLSQIMNELASLRSPGLEAIVNMKGLDRPDIKYEESLGAEVGPANSYPPSLILKDDKVRIGNSTMKTSNLINCSVATWSATMAQRLPELESEFGGKMISDVLRQWMISGGYPAGSKGPVAVIERLNLGCEITDHQDIREGDLLQTWHYNPNAPVDKQWEGHSSFVTGVKRDEISGKVIRLETISANLPNGSQAIKKDVPLKHLKQYLENKDGYHMYVARMFTNPPDMSLPKGDLLTHDRLLQAQADSLDSRIASVAKLKSLEDELQAGLSPREAVDRLIELLERCQVDPVALEAAITRIWIEAGGEGEPPRHH